MSYGHPRQFLDGSHGGFTRNHLSHSRTWLLVFLELSSNLGWFSKVKGMKRGNSVSMKKK
jgi:hypothetical protein